MYVKLHNFLTELENSGFGIWHKLEQQNGLEDVN